jgi:hypothetical protein
MAERHICAAPNGMDMVRAGTFLDSAGLRHDPADNHQASAVVTRQPRRAATGPALRLLRRCAAVVFALVSFLAATLPVTPSAEAATLPGSPPSMRVVTFQHHRRRRDPGKRRPPVAALQSGFAGYRRRYPGFDVVGLQEVAAPDHLVAVARAAGYPYAEFTPPTSDPRPYAYPDVALLSRTPMSNIVGSSTLGGHRRFPR